MKLARAFRVVLPSAPPAASCAGDSEGPVVLRRLTEGVLKRTARRLINRATGETFTDSTGPARKPEIVRLRSSPPN